VNRTPSSQVICGKMLIPSSTRVKASPLTAVYAVGCVSLEFRASIKTREYFANHPLKGAQTQDNPYYSNTLASDGDFPGYLNRLDALNPNEYNARHCFADVYDQFMAPRR
jgi:hypothetical protein